MEIIICLWDSTGIYARRIVSLSLECSLTILDENKCIK